MFELDPKLSALEAKPENLREIYHSLNTAEVAAKGFVGEPAKAFICLLSLSPQRLGLFVSFFFPNKNRAIFYPYNKNPFAPSRLDEVKEEAMLFLESFGFILEQVIGEHSSAGDKENWMGRLPLFKIGAPTGEIVLRSSSPAFPADGAGQLIISSEVIRDTGGEIVADGTRVKVGTSLGLLGTLEAEPEERQVTVTTTEGMITFLLKAPAKAGKAVITAASEEGSAVGELTVDFLPLEPEGEIKLEALPPRPYADGQTVVTLQSEPVCDRLGNVAAEGALFTIEISDRERVLSSVQVASKKGVISHRMIAPAEPATKLITARSEKGLAQGELALTFQAPFTFIEEELPPPALSAEELSAEASLAELSVEEGEPAAPEPSPAEEEIPAAVKESLESPVSTFEELPEEFTFKEEELVSAVEGGLEKATEFPLSPVAAPAVEEKVKEEIPSAAPPEAEGFPLPSEEPVKELPLLEPMLPAEEAAPPKEAPVPLAVMEVEPQPSPPEEMKKPLPVEPPAVEAVKPQWQDYQELVRFLTRM